jgi:hypothetical protein
MSPRRQALEPYEAQPFTWEEPLNPHTLILELDFPAVGTMGIHYDSLLLLLLLLLLL